MLNGNRLDETLRDATLRTKVLPFALKCYSSYVVLLFALACYFSLALLGLKVKVERLEVKDSEQYFSASVI